MSRKSGHRFCEKDMLKKSARARPDSIEAGRALMSPIGQQRRHANEGGEGLSDDICGNARKVRAQSTLILEAFSKRACCKDRAEFRHYAAANVDTAACAEGQRA
jgi:hypothetical protein